MKKKSGGLRNQPDLHHDPKYQESDQYHRQATASAGGTRRAPTSQETATRVMINLLKGHPVNTLNNYRPGYQELVTGYIATKCKWTPAYANAVTADALRFLAVCADHPGERLVSSEDVDEVVDTFVLDTELLRWLEAGLGREVVYTPSYAHDPIERARASTAYTVTMEYMRRSGPVDPHIWREMAGCWTSCRLTAKS